MFDRISRSLANWRATQETNGELSRLSDAQLADIGLTRDEIPQIARRAAQSK